MSHLKPRIKHISLKFLGDGWEDAYVQFRALKWDDVKDFDPTTMDNHVAVGRMLDVLEQSFVAGSGVGEDGQPVALSAADMREFDLETQGNLFQRLSGTGDPND